MKKILIVNNNMHIGGVQKALISLLWAIRGQFDVTLLLFYPGGPCLKELPPDVKVIAPDSGYRYLGMTKYDVKNTKDKLGRAFFAAITRTMGREKAIWLMGLGQKRLSGFDAAISYLHNGGEKVFYGGCNDFVLNHVDAKRKIAFLHCDYSLCGADTRSNARQYARFDRIAACSRGCAEAFIKSNPTLQDRVQVVPNCHRFDRILDLAEAAPVEREDGNIHVVTVARLGREKGVERALRAIAALGPEKENLRYHIIGDGIQKDLLLRIMEEENISHLVRMHGMLENPYGHVRSADLLLIPSYSEAAPLVIGEAASLGTPVASTLTSSAREKILDTGFGWVCDNSEEGIASLLRELLTHPQDLAEKRAELTKHVFDNSQALAGFEAVIG